MKDFDNMPLRDVIREMLFSHEPITHIINHKEFETWKVILTANLTHLTFNELKTAIDIMKKSLNVKTTKNTEPESTLETSQEQSLSEKDFLEELFLKPLASTQINGLENLALKLKNK